MRALVINAILGFAVTRHRAGRAIEEGAAEMMWLRYPASVLVNALAWTLMLAMLGGFVRIFRRGG
jgi:hypothetical protein